MKRIELDLENQNTAEFAVSKFFESWVKKDYKNINNYIQKTFLNGHDKVFNTFEKIFGKVELSGFYIYDKEIVTNCREEVHFRADVLLNKKIVNMYGRANTICETAPYAPSPTGQWGVNPISILRWVKRK